MLTFAEVLCMTNTLGYFLGHQSSSSLTQGKGSLSEITSQDTSIQQGQRSKNTPHNTSTGPPITPATGESWLNSAAAITLRNNYGSPALDKSSASNPNPSLVTRSAAGDLSAVSPPPTFGFGIFGRERRTSEAASRSIFDSSPGKAPTEIKQSSGTMPPNVTSTSKALVGNSFGNAALSNETHSPVQKTPESFSESRFARFMLVRTLKITFVEIS